MGLADDGPPPLSLVGRTDPARLESGKVKTP
jgi:hypothetical protein